MAIAADFHHNQLQSVRRPAVPMIFFHPLGFKVDRIITDDTKSSAEAMAICSVAAVYRGKNRRVIVAVGRDAYSGPAQAGIEVDPEANICGWRRPQLNYPSIQAAIGLSVVANDFGHTHPIVVKNLAPASRVQ